MRFKLLKIYFKYKIKTVKMLFYLFQTQVSNIYKFGMTKHNLSIQRLNDYYGLNIPKKIITIYSVVNGFEEEQKFKSFLNEHNVKISFGKAFFEYNNDIDMLLLKYKLNCYGKSETELPQSTDIFIDFLRHLATVNSNSSVKYIYGKNLFNLFVDWCNEHNTVSDCFLTKFGRKIKTYEGVSKKLNRSGVKYCLDFDKITDFLKTKNDKRIM